MNKRITTAENQMIIQQDFAAFVNDEVLPLTSMDPGRFWSDFEQLVMDFSPRNKQLLEKRDALQAQIDEYHRQNEYHAEDLETYKAFLREIGYLQEEGDDFTISTTNVDPEIAGIAGSQLVVPLKNARFALNAANARWGSLYDALYGTDVIPNDKSPEGTESRGYDPERGAKVIAYGRDFLDRIFPLVEGSHHDVLSYEIQYHHLVAALDNGKFVGLRDSGKFVGFIGHRESPTAILLKNNGLHVEIQIDLANTIGRDDKANVTDIKIESALTTIMDCEDSIAAVDTEDKLEVYRNWLGLMIGDLTATFHKGGKKITRRCRIDRAYTARNREDGVYIVPGRSLMLIRNVGHLMDTDIIRDRDGNNIPEGILDGVITSLIALIDLQKSGGMRNSHTDSVYIVKPKMHGPEEVAFTCDLFSRIEDMLGTPRNTLKLGIMDEERRTTLNLKECIRVARDRVVFINTGFLDRTGDEIHTSTAAGAFMPKEEIKSQPWINAYEDRNVDIGLACGLQGRAQIGKGMWAMPSEMGKMMEQKIAHPLAGATTAWVPSPTAATLHALHYHEVDVFAVQDAIKQRERAPLDDILTIPLMRNPAALTEEQIERELENNAQGILGYVVRWIELGIGCSTVPDINNIGLMEDRATLRISSQHICNWLLHGVCTEDQVMTILRRMAGVVDTQNSDSEGYVNMMPDSENSMAFKAAKALVFEGLRQPNGYTEPLLHSHRLAVKDRQAKQQNDQ